MNNYSLLKSKTFWTIIIQSAYDIWQLVAPSAPPTISAVVNVVLPILASYFHLQTGNSTTGTN